MAYDIPNESKRAKCQAYGKDANKIEKIYVYLVVG